MPLVWRVYRSPLGAHFNDIYAFQKLALLKGILQPDTAEKVEYVWKSALTFLWWSSPICWDRRRLATLRARPKASTCAARAAATSARPTPFACWERRRESRC